MSAPLWPVNWIEDYLTYTKRQVSPRAFHFWSAVAVIAGALERRVWFSALGGKLKLYPGQIMVVLVSKSAITKKTTAATIATRFLRFLEPWQCYRVPSKVSPQQLLKGLERLDEAGTPVTRPDGSRVNSAGFLFAGELGRFFTTEAFSEALATHFNDLNDCPPGKVRIEFRSWTADLWQPCVTMLGCITPRGIASELPRSARTAGFFGRILWVHADSTDRAISLMDRGAVEDRQLADELGRQLQRIASLERGFAVSRRAHSWYQHWYHEVYFPWAQQLDLPESEQTGYWGRKDAHLLRVAMVLALAEAPQKLLLKERHLLHALQELERIERTFPRAMAELGTSPMMDYEQKFLELLERWTQRHLAQGRHWMPAERLQHGLFRYAGRKRFFDAMDTLEGAGQIERRRVNERTEIRRRFTAGRLLRGAEEEGSEEGSMDGNGRMKQPGDRELEG